MYILTSTYNTYVWRVHLFHHRAIGRSENPGVPVLFCGHNLPPLVEIGLTDLPKVPGDDTPVSPQPTYEQNGKHRLFFQNFEMTSESRITCPLQLENLSSVRIHIVQLKIISPSF